jgi:DEAD/DEAH box helicase domain-containing protein
LNRCLASQEPGTLKNIVYFDLETQKSFDEVGRRGNIRDLKMSLGVTFSTTRGGYLVYPEKKVNELIEELRRADLVVGFNHEGFDYTVLQGYNDFFDAGQVRSLDMMLEMERVLGHRVSLDSVASATLGLEKTSEGLQAVRWWREGKLLEIAEYCCFDVKITKMVHEYGVANGRLFFNNRQGRKITVSVDW